MNYFKHFYCNKIIHGIFFVLVSMSTGVECKQRSASQANENDFKEIVAQKATMSPAIASVVKNIENSKILSQVSSIKPPDKASSKLSLDQIYALSKDKKSTQSSTRSQSIIPTQKSTDLYTQSQAHMSVPEVKALIDSKYKTKPYEKLIKATLDREKEYADHYVFYHGTDNVWRLPQDLYTRLYTHFSKASVAVMKDFIFLRFSSGLNDVDVSKFLTKKLRESGLINDHRLGSDLLAANLALFGSVGNASECTWGYFIKSREHTNPTRTVYESIMNTFKLSHKYIDEIMKLIELYQTKEQTILQIFVPKNLVNQIGYLAWIRGIPADQPIMHTVLRSVQDKKFDKTAPALDHYSKLFRQEQEKQPLFKGLIERLSMQEFSLDYFLTFYRNRPADIEDINIFQARLFLTNSVLLNPLSGVKIFRVSTATDAQLKKYHEKLDGIIKKMIAEKQ
jgi:hypothetical protein